MGIIIVILIGAIILILFQRNFKKQTFQTFSESAGEDTNESSSIFFHEDDYKQVEIVPSENFGELIKQAENVQDFAEKHFDGGAFTDIMIREENGFKLKNRGIKPRELDLILLHLPINKYTEVSTGIRPGEMNSENTYGYGENYNGIFFDFEFDSVTGIWIVGSPEVQNKEFVQVLNNIGNKWNLLLMDWNSLELIDLKDKEQIENYLN